MAPLPKVRDGSLLQQTAGEMSFDPIRIGTAEWYTWLEHHRSFCFEAQECRFTARKEQRPAGWYWYASRRVHGKLHRAYIGKSAALTPERLNEVADILEKAGDALQGLMYRPRRMPGSDASQVPQVSLIPLPTNLNLAEALTEPEPVPKHNLPVQLTPLIGRGQDVAIARSLLLRPEVRLL